MNSSSNTLKAPGAPMRATPPAPATARPGSLARFGAAVWRALERVGQSRAQRELLALADRWQPTQPELAAQLRAIGRPGARL